MPNTQPEIVRDYTTTKRVPTLVGRFRDGLRLPGGPYTLVQVAIFVVLLLLLNGSRPLWGAAVPELMQWVIVLGGAVGGAWAARSLPRTTRNVPAVVLGYLGALLSPPAGKIRGRLANPLRPRMTGRTSKRAAARAGDALFAAQLGGLLIGPGESALEASAPAPSNTSELEITPAAFTGVDRLRALTRKESS